LSTGLAGAGKEDMKDRKRENLDRLGDYFERLPQEIRGLF